MNFGTRSLRLTRKRMSGPENKSKRLSTRSTKAELQWSVRFPPARRGEGKPGGKGVLPVDRIERFDSTIFLYPLPCVPTLQDHLLSRDSVTKPISHRCHLSVL